MTAIYYQPRRHYRYTLAKSCEFELGWQLPQPVESPFISLSRDGRLRLAERYAWDGASGPMPDLPSIMRASLLHDALYQLMREGHLDRQRFRRSADQLLLQACRADGMNVLLAYWVYACVRLFGERHARSNMKTLANPSLHDTQQSIATERN
ncbi:hypothetical protein [Chitinibacter sp. GC72]|uniref:hypothetical protein n=1 Tax=Chitinibacter sp. GC72 TaxID=1526917 RepID=UPI0012FA2B80|nr:hypothetical protein [Chitinibacter sp. GC72]